MIHRLLGIGALVAMLTACGGQPAAVAPTSAPPVALQPTDTVAKNFPRTIQDLDGSVEIATQPKRIVALNQIALQYLAPFIGQVELVGYAKRDGMSPDLVELLKDVPSFDSEQLGANIELIVKWQPDLAFESDSGGYFEPVEQAVKVVNLPLIRPGSWRDSTRMIGTALGLEDYAAKLIADTDARIQAEARPNRGTMAIAYMYTPGLITFETDGTALGGLLEELGFELVSPKDPASPWEEVSLEVAAERLNVDHLLISNYGQAAVDGIIAQPVLAAVPVIAEKRYTVTTREVADAATFFGPASAAFVLEALRVLPNGLATPAAAPATTRTVTDDLGRAVTIPASPQRIVALQDLQVLRPLLDLGVTPIASVTHPRAEGAFRFVEEYDVSGIEIIGLLGEPNMEQLVQLKPDLIIGTLSAGTQDQLETLSAIAPTVVYNAGRPVIEYHRSLAEAVGALEAYDALMADYEARLAELREGVAPIRDELVVSLLAFNPNAGQIEIGEGPYTLIFEGAGINQPEPQVNFESADEGVRRYWISLEQLPEHDADLILLLYSNDPAVNAPITDSPIWSTLKAVQAGQVVEIDGGTWYVQSVRSLFNVINALEQHLVGTTVDTSVVE